MKGMLIVVSASCVVLSALLGTAILRYGDIGSAVAVMHGERVVPSPRVVEFGECLIGTPYVKKATLTNFSGEEVVLGEVTYTCSCVRLKTTKIVIPRGESRTIDIEAVFTERRQDARQTIEMILKGDEFHVVRLHVLATAVPGPEPTLAPAPGGAT